jgi:CubicO group peptidase (beta-lactamase class C family)
MQRDTIFRIYSMSKPITSVAVLMLFEEGKLRLTDPVDRLLPELADLQVLEDPAGPLDATSPSPTPITIRDLLTHTSGLAYSFTSTGPLSNALVERGLSGSGAQLSPDDWIRELGELPLMHAPGTKWHYSLSTDVLGVVVARASGMPFAEFLRTRIFEPLEIRDTAFFVPPEKRDRLAVNYRENAETGELEIVDHPSTTSFARPPAFASGGGGLVSTADDYLRFASMILNRGELDGVRILSRKGIELMTQNALTPEEKVPDAFGFRFFASGQGFGLGVGVVEEVGLTATLGSAGKNGWGGAAGSWYWIDPKERLIGILMIQRMRGGEATPISQDFQTLVYRALE